jgi:hypothetical protein
VAELMFPIPRIALNNGDLLFSALGYALNRSCYNDRELVDEKPAD